jgi:aminopeptidase
MSDPRVVNLARTLVQYSVEVKDGDRVCIVGIPYSTGAQVLLDEIYRSVLLAGGRPSFQILPQSTEYIFFKEANEEQLLYVDPIADMVVNTYDCLIWVTSEDNTRYLNTIEPSREALYQKGRSEIGRAMFERAASGELRWALTAFPSPGSAQDAEVSLEEFEDFVYRATFSDQDDPIKAWQDVRGYQEGLIGWLLGKREVQIKGPNIDLSFSIEGRSFENCCGKENMPDGEIFTGPLESSAQGWVRFSFPAIFVGREVENVELTFEDGKVVKAVAGKNETFLNEILDTDAGSRYLGEFGIGTNRGIDLFTKKILFDEKIAGTIHLALGRGYPETGSRNESAIHWDMICDMREGGRIYVDDELFYEAGDFMIDRPGN